MVRLALMGISIVKKIYIIDLLVVSANVGEMFIFTFSSAIGTRLTVQIVRIIVSIEMVR